MRLPTWEAALNTLVADALGRRFEWGKFDCCTFAADAVQAVTGSDRMADLRGTYACLRTALRVLEAEGGLRQAVSRRLGAPRPEHEILYAQRGDIVLHNVEGYPALAVVLGANAMAPTAAGIQRLAGRDWLAAWAVN
jgi:hypothetical protein